MTYLAVTTRRESKGSVGPTIFILREDIDQLLAECSSQSTSNRSEYKARALQRAVLELIKEKLTGFIVNADDQRKGSRLLSSTRGTPVPDKDNSRKSLTSQNSTVPEALIFFQKHILENVQLMAFVKSGDPNLSGLIDDWHKHLLAMLLAPSD
jgi:hypothetical protein